MAEKSILYTICHQKNSKSNAQFVKQPHTTIKIQINKQKNIFTKLLQHPQQHNNNQQQKIE